ncbi:MAG: YdcF family protein [Cyclobacteriaceae bacterium]|nr:YdcF family protein [Cyclobacteriaceae bacterium]
MKKEILIVLGSPNSPSGELSDISKGRLDFCASLYSTGKLVLCTGGWGKHFNTSSEAHAVYAKKYLIEKGISEADFLDFALSENTVDDAIKIKKIVSKLKNPDLTIVTSDYHLERVQLIFQEILKEFNLNCIGVQSNLEQDQFHRLMKHERAAINLIIKNGLYY